MRLILRRTLELRTLLLILPIIPALSAEHLETKALIANSHTLGVPNHL